MSLRDLIRGREEVAVERAHDVATAVPAAIAVIQPGAEKPVNVDPDAGEFAAVKLVNTVIGDLWLVRDDDALAEHPDIIRSGLPVFFFDEVQQLRGKTVEELRAIGMVKAEFPTARVLQ